MLIVSGWYLRSPAFGTFFGYFAQVVHVAPVERQQRTEFGEQDAGACADARASAGDQRHFPPQRGHLKDMKHKSTCCPPNMSNIKAIINRTRANTLTLKASLVVMTSTWHSWGGSGDSVH